MAMPSNPAHHAVRDRREPNGTVPAASVRRRSGWKKTVQRPWVSASHAISGEALGWVDNAIARIGGRTAQSLFSPCFEIVYSIHNPPTQLVVGRSGAETAVLLKRAGRQTQVNSCVRGAQVTRAYWGWNGVHKKSPLGAGGGGQLPPLAEWNGASVRPGGSDKLAGRASVTPGAAMRLPRSKG